jgi:AcrR family transcriptional regulator
VGRSPRKESASRRVTSAAKRVAAAESDVPRLGRSHSASKPISAELLRASRRMFLRDGTLEMRSLARELNVGRATLYRWARDRENLLSEVLLSLGLANLKYAERDVNTPAGPRRVCDVTDLYLKRMRSNPSLEKFLRLERDVAERVMMNPRGKLYRGWESVWADFVRRVEQSSDWKAPLAAPALSRIMMRVSNAFMLAGLHLRGRPDTDTPSMVLRLILGIANNLDSQRC